MASVFLSAISGRNNVPHGPFRIPHLTLHVIDHPLPAKECRSAAPMAQSVLLASSPHGICVPQCDLWAKKVPHGPFRIPHLTLHVIDHPLPAKECRSAAPMAQSVLLASSPHGICVPQCDLWAYKTPAWPHSIIPHPTDHSTFNIPRSTFHVQHSTFNIPHSTFHIPRSTFNIPHST